MTDNNIRAQFPADIYTRFDQAQSMSERTTQPPKPQVQDKLDFVEIQGEVVETRSADARVDINSADKPTGTSAVLQNMAQSNEASKKLPHDSLSDVFMQDGGSGRNLDIIV